MAKVEIRMNGVHWNNFIVELFLLFTSFYLTVSISLFVIIVDGIPFEIMGFDLRKRENKSMSYILFAKKKDEM